MATIEQMLLKQKSKERKEKIICDDYVKLRKEFPSVAICAIFDTLADKYHREDTNVSGSPFPITGQQIRNIIIKHGLYTPRRYKRE